MYITLDIRTYRLPKDRLEEPYIKDVLLLFSFCFDFRFCSSLNNNNKLQ
ncbi:unnamed protein product [Schistosoma curassoni]|uniref:Uncharacterized protein n=1 Tax=Schistosoma curassoni TaxID=6186 RepID=A0A183JRH1_9TREM|nr:unnamed protein product [Schistosoma curassoni]